MVHQRAKKSSQQKQTNYYKLSQKTLKSNCVALYFYLYKKIELPFMGDKTGYVSPGPITVLAISTYVAETYTLWLTFQKPFVIF